MNFASKAIQKARAFIVHNAFKATVPYSVHYLTQMFKREDALIEKPTDFTDSENFELMNKYYKAMQESILEFYNIPEIPDNMKGYEAPKILRDAMNVGFSFLDSDPAYQRLLIIFDKKIRGDK